MRLCPNCKSYHIASSCYNERPRIPFKCPVCDGTGLVSRPPGIAGDIQSWSSAELTHPCKPCDASGIVWLREGS